MALASYFYHNLTKKYIAAFGSLFNQVTIERTHPESNEQTKIIVPMSYGPWQKFIPRVTQSPDLVRKEAITYPRMSFEINSIQYDSQRKLNTMKRIRTGGPHFKYVPTPYNIDISLYIGVKYAEDGYKIMEQILPFFTPDYTPTIKLFDDMESIDIPIVLTGVSVENSYEGNFEDRQVILHTITFQISAFYFGPSKERKLIKFVDMSVNDPMSDIDVHLIDKDDPSKHWRDVELGDNWSSKVVISEEREDE